MQTLSLIELRSASTDGVIAIVALAKMHTPPHCTCSNKP